MALPQATLTVSSHAQWDHIVASGRLPELQAWLRANGIPPDHVPIDTDVTIHTGEDGQQLIRYATFCVDADGHRYLKVPDDPRSDLATTHRITPLLIDPPATWPWMQTPVAQP